MKIIAMSPMLKVIKNCLKLCVVLIIKLANNFVYLRFGLINRQALGHLIFDTEVNYLSSYSVKIKRKKDFWYELGPSSNEVISRFWQSKLRSSNNPFILKIYSALKSYGKNERNLLSKEIGAGDGEILDDFPVQFSFSDGELLRIQKLQEFAKLNSSSRLVLLCLRDDQYYLKRGDFRNILNHSHRNVDVDNYRECVSYLLDEGFSVIRMGRIAEKKLKINHENFIDLPFLEEVHESIIGLQNRELLELSLFERCNFCISSGLGTDALATMFRKRVYYTDYYSLFNLYSSKLFPSFLPKGYIEASSNRILDPEEIFRGNFLFLQSAFEFEKMGIKLENCSSQAITHFVKSIVQGELSGNLMNESLLSIKHAQYLRASHFKGKFVPKVSDYWLNNNNHSPRI